MTADICGEWASGSVGWVLSGDESVPGARINGSNIHRQLRARGVDSHILRQPSGYAEVLAPGEADIVLQQCLARHLRILVLQKVNGPEACRLVSRAQSHSIKTVFLACDTVDNHLASACDVTFTVSGALRGLFSRRIRGGIQVLDDAVEVPPRFRSNRVAIPREGRLRAAYLGSHYPDQHILRLLDWCRDHLDVVLISSPPNRPVPVDAEGSRPQRMPRRRSVFGRACGELLTATRKYGAGVIPRLWRRARYRFVPAPTPPPHPPAGGFEFVPWQLDTVYEVLSTCQVGLIPIRLDSDFKMAKSANRLGTFMAFGMPTIVSPLPAYTEHLAGDARGSIARSSREWSDAARRLDQDREFAEGVGAAAHEYAWRHFAPEIIAARFWRSVCGRALG